jgi:hypothetical protein
LLSGYLQTKTHLPGEIFTWEFNFPANFYPARYKYISHYQRQRLIYSPPQWRRCQNQISADKTSYPARRPFAKSCPHLSQNFSEPIIFPEGAPACAPCGSKSYFLDTSRGACRCGAIKPLQQRPCCVTTSERARRAKFDDDSKSSLLSALLSLFCSSNAKQTSAHASPS